MDFSQVLVPSGIGCHALTAGDPQNALLNVLSLIVIRIVMSANAVIARALNADYTVSGNLKGKLIRLAYDRIHSFRFL